jgi:hypothetical protein
MFDFGFWTWAQLARRDPKSKINIVLEEAIRA